MTQPTSDGPPAYLEGEEAISWYVRRKGRGTTFDTHLAFVREIFGADADVSVRAATDPGDGEPRTLLIEVNADDLSDDEAWSRIVSVQEMLIARRAFLAEARRVKQPFRDILVYVRPPLDTWSQLQADFEDQL